MVDPRLGAEIASQPHRFVYATVTGDRLWGLPSEDEYDVRACHVLPARDVLGLNPPRDTLAYSAHREGLDVEVVSHDLAKLCLLLLKKNGQVLEHILSPLVVHTTPEHEELKEIARACASTHMAHHYASHARMLWEQPHTAKNVARALRVLRTACDLMRTGEIAFDPAPAIEQPLDLPRLRLEYDNLQAQLEVETDKSPLPPAASKETRARLSDLLVRLRLDG